MKNGSQNIVNENKWYALYVNSRAEKKAMEALISRGIEAYVPLAKTLRQWSDRKKMVELPLLNGYVFVNITENKKDLVLQTKGVVSFVRFEGKMANIREDEINRLKQLVKLGYHIESTSTVKEFKSGEKIKILSGPLKSVEGFVMESKGEHFIEIVLESIGQSLRVKLPKEILIGVN